VNSGFAAVQGEADTHGSVEGGVVAEYAPHGAHGPERQTEVVPQTAGMDLAMRVFGALHYRSAAEKHGVMGSFFPVRDYLEDRPPLEIRRQRRSGVAPVAETAGRFFQPSSHAHIAGGHIGGAARQQSDYRRFPERLALQQLSQNCRGGAVAAVDGEHPHAPLGEFGQGRGDVRGGLRLDVANGGRPLQTRLDVGEAIPVVAAGGVADQSDRGTHLPGPLPFALTSFSSVYPMRGARPATFSGIPDSES